MFAELQVMADQMGYHFDSLVRVAEGYVVVLVDTMEGELRYSGATPEAAVQRAIDSLALVMNRDDQ